MINVHTASIVDSRLKTANTDALAVWYAPWGIIPSAGEGAWKIDGNVLSGAVDGTRPVTDEFGDGVELFDVITGVTVSGYRVVTNAENRVALFGATHVVVTSDTISHNGYDGVYIGPTTTVASAHDTVSGNALSRNAQCDGQDLDYTSDAWTGNTCSPKLDASPEYLC